jgi:hypothetical protein
MKSSQVHSTARVTSAGASTNATLAKSSSADLHSIEAYNTTASIKYLKLYNKISAPVVGTDVPFLTFALPPSARFYKELANGGIYFSAGLGFALTGANGDSDTTALTAGDVVGLNLIFS